ncbi:unnamed protein product [Eruca vesicaria subsp. sativa]|uniref:Protein kinase domain-containing protein n=1 Tax=Eruca vesicaria subsp. sativa TaxID=29727 RepID=A0ABC8JAX6_ERUVS|nr:unnamed protein product [Eruca vesicaria subsp. sativa]
MATRFKFSISLALTFSFFFYTTLSFTEDVELASLLRFKSTIDDPKNSLSSWSNTSSFHHCNWTGITCTKAPSLYVSSINLKTLNLSGEISDSVCNLPYLTHLDLSQNLFNQPIPLHLSACLTLETLNLSTNLIWGTIPDQISEFTALQVLDLSSNHVEGKIPEGLGLLTNLEVLNLGSNLLTGLVPNVIGKLSELVVLDLSENSYLVSEIPSSIGKLDKLEELLLHRSGFHGEVPTSFVGLKSLKVLDLCLNNLTGGITRSLGDSLKSLVSLDVSQNKITGSFPSGVCSGKRLVSLSLHSNFFEGSLPKSIGECLSLERLQVQENRFSGEFPVGLWSSPRIKIIRAGNNKFTGQVPESISLASSLEQVEIDNNSFSGEIPHGLGVIKNLYKFSASENGFKGGLPPNFCDSPVLSIVNISHNSLSGKIPEVKNCKKLVSLSLAGNAFTGGIPPSLAELHVLTYLDLSANKLTGLIPQELGNLKLALFNVSYNRLSGVVPHSLVSGLPASFLQGNPGLCGPGLPHPSCSSHRFSFHKALLLLLICFVLALATSLFMSYRYYRKKAQFKSTWRSEFYYPLRLTEQELMKVVNESSPSDVYVLSLSSGELIAVKKLVNSRNVSSKALKAEVRTIAKIRHKNIIRILGFCFTDELIFLIYEYTHNGSLYDMPKPGDDQLQWSVRLKIALGVAQALAYISKDYVPHLLHRNLKSTNILLDKDFEPKISDFALDQIVGESAFQSLIHTTCYTAPENNYSKKATEEMDVYSFGVVLLELVTGQRAEEEGASGESLDIVKQVRRKINLTDGAAQVLDQKIFSNSCQSDMLKTLDIALNCIAVAAEKRPSLVQVIKALEGIINNSSTEKLPVSA